MAFVKRQDTEVVQHDERVEPRDFAGLSTMLQSENAAARRWAARDLATFAQASSVLTQRLKIEQDASVREGLLMSMAQIGDAIAVQGLVDCLRSDDAYLRNEAITAMKLLPDAVAPIMTGLLSDADPDVRIFSVNILESLRHKDVEKWLIDVISNDPHINVCATAVDLLGEVGTVAAAASLSALKSRFPEDPYISFAANLALHRIGEA